MQKISNRCKVIRYSMTYNWEDNDYCMSENPADGKWVPSGDYDRLAKQLAETEGMLGNLYEAAEPYAYMDKMLDTELAAYRAEYGEE